MTSGMLIPILVAGTAALAIPVRPARPLPPAVPTTSGSVTTASGLKYIDVRTGSGMAAKAGDRIVVHYIGTFADGKKFDSSRDRGQPFDFDLGQGRVIKGFDEGFVGMKVGGLRRLIIPSELGYGKRGAGAVIPPNTELHFEVELLRIQ